MKFSEGWTFWHAVCANFLPWDLQNHEDSKPKLGVLGSSSRKNYYGGIMVTFKWVLQQHFYFQNFQFYFFINSQDRIQNNLPLWHKLIFIHSSSHLLIDFQVAIMCVMCMPGNKICVLLSGWRNSRLWVVGHCQKQVVKMKRWYVLVVWTFKLKMTLCFVVFSGKFPASGAFQTPAEVLSLFVTVPDPNWQHGEMQGW